MKQIRAKDFSEEYLQIENPNVRPYFVIKANHEVNVFASEKW